MKNPKSIDSAASLEATYHALIPISAHMGIRVQDYDGKRLVLTAPLANNINHQMSGFGGSLFSVAALAGWGLLQLKFGELDLDANTVIASGDVTYSKPVLEDFTCVCTLPADYPAFAGKLTKTGRASLNLVPQIETSGDVAMTLTGKYVVSVNS